MSLRESRMDINLDQDDLQVFYGASGTSGTSLDHDGQEASSGLLGTSLDHNGLEDLLRKL